MNTPLAKKRDENNERAGSKFKSYAHFHANVPIIKSRLSLKLPEGDEEKVKKRFRSLQRAVLISLGAGLAGSHAVFNPPTRCSHSNS